MWFNSRELNGKATYLEVGLGTTLLASLPSVALFPTLESRVLTS